VIPLLWTQLHLASEYILQPSYNHTLGDKPLTIILSAQIQHRLKNGRTKFRVMFSCLRQMKTAMSQWQV